MIRSNGARAASSGEFHSVGHREQQLAGAVAQLHAVDRRIVARDVDRDAGRCRSRCTWLRATARAPRRRAGRCPCRCRRCWRSARPRARACRARRGSRWWSHAGRCRRRGSASISKGIVPGGRAAVGRRVDVEAAGADRLKPGLAHRHPVRLAELLDRAARPMPRPRSSAISSSARLHARNKRGSASRRASLGSARRRPAPADRRLSGNRSSASRDRFALRAGARDGDADSSLAPAAFLRQPLVELLRQRRRIVPAGVRSSSSGGRAQAVGHAGSPTGAASAGCRTGSRRPWRCDARKAATIGRVVAEAVVVAADRRQAVGIDDRPADAAVAAAPSAS